MNTYPKYTHLVLSGGGFAGLIYTGALGFIQDHYIDKSIKHVTGVSIGAFFGFLFVLGVPMVEVDAYLRSYLVDRSNVFVENMTLLDALSNYCIIDSDILVRPLKFFLKEHAKWTSDDITFVEFAKLTGKTFSCCASNITDFKSELFTVNTHPDVSVLTAIKASMAIPMVIPPIKINDKLYVDGFLTPLYQDLSEQRVGESILFLRVFLKVVNDVVDDKDKIKDVNDIPNIFNYFQMLIKTLTSHDKLKIKCDKYIPFDKCPLMSLPIEFEENGLCIIISEEKIKESYKYGYDVMSKEFILT